MKIRKRVLVATFHMVVAFVYLIMWMAKWSAGGVLRDEKQPVEVWQTPTAYMVGNIMALRYRDLDCHISIYDGVFHRVCNDLGTDWCLMSAIAYMESRFIPYARSQTGAIGLMQIMPRTATIYGITSEEVADPEVNIYVASLHYNLIDYMLDLPDSIPAKDRMALNLACYNGGIGRVQDAQRLARYMGEDPCVWSVISQHLLNLRESEFYDLEIVRLGRFGTARHTVSYVNRVMRRYDLYCKKTADCSHHLYPVTGHAWRE